MQHLVESRAPATRAFGGASCTHDLRRSLRFSRRLPWRQRVLAQDAKKPMPPNPVGASGTWTQTVKKEAAIAGEEFDKKQIELIQKVTAYFNQMSEIKGLFVQTSADNKRMRGKFYVKRPGRFRFDYNLAEPDGDPV